MKNKRHKIRGQTSWGLLAVIVAIALAIRLYDLGNLPSGLYCDEAANGYDAYSLLKTGRSLYGHTMPLFLNHHNIDYVESMYTYLTIPFVKLLGLTVFSTRLLAALAGTCSVLTTFVLARELFNKSVGLVAAFLVTFSPWHLIFSRIAFRGILLPLFVTLGIYLFLRALKNYKYCIPCGLVFGLALHTYGVAKVCIPLLLLCLASLYHEKLIAFFKSNRKVLVHVFLACVVFVVLALPVFYFSLWGPGNKRFWAISIFNDSHPVRLFVRNYLLHLTPHFLFFRGDLNLRHSLPKFGELQVVLIPFVLLGLGTAVRKRERSFLLAPLVFLIGIIPAALTNKGIPHALRSIGALPFMEITAAVGIVFFLGSLFSKSRYAGIILTYAVAIALLVNSVIFIHAYFGRYRVISQDAFQHGMKEAVMTAEKESDRYDHIILSPQINQPYVFCLFFTKSDPAEYQKKRTLGKYIVRDGKKNEFDIPPGRNLLILRAYEYSDAKEVKKWIRGADRKAFLKLVDCETPTNKKEQMESK